MENNGLILTEEELSQLTPEEREIIESAWGITTTVDLLPEDIKEVLEKFEQLTANKTVNESVRKLFELAKTDSKLYAQLMAMVELADIEPEAPVATTNPNILALSDEEYVKAEKAFFESIVAMSPEKRKEFAEVLKNLSPEQEKAMLAELAK